MTRAQLTGTARFARFSSILNPAFTYTPSYATDIRITFARARAEMQMQAVKKINAAEASEAGDAWGLTVDDFACII